LGDRGTPRLAAGEITAILKEHGFKLIGQPGSHQKWRNPATGKQVIVADRHGRTLPLGTIRSIIAGSGVPLDKWRA
jgi:predicted RNA binding protein YcfA (HicA-like mRNA interferase family)